MRLPALLSLSLFSSSSSSTSNIGTQAAAYTYTTVLCVVRVRFFSYVNKREAFFLLVPRRTHTYVVRGGHVFLYVRGEREEEKKKKEREEDSRVDSPALLAPREIEKESSRNDVNTASSFSALLLLFLLIHDITAAARFLHLFFLYYSVFLLSPSLSSHVSEDIFLSSLPPSSTTSFCGLFASYAIPLSLFPTRVPNTTAL